jgi:gliding motility-associated-like protein
MLIFYLPSWQTAYHYMGIFYQNSIFSFSNCKKITISFIILFGLIAVCNGQCPPNIDFEKGDFTGWKCWIGTHTVLSTSPPSDTINLGSTPVAGPIIGRHTMLTSPTNGLDPYGQFPRNCPNGSGHSIQLGNSSSNREAEGVSYDFTIPANVNQFNLIYYYAVVFQDPGHPAYQQPKLVIQITNLTDNSPISCSSFSFVAGSGLPGFFVSPNNSSVICKNWSATSINLDGMAGKTIRLFFKTGDCTQGAHFGYAYVDVNTECGSSFVGATYCPDDTAINVTAPFGYQNYLWYDQNYTQVLGNQQVLRLQPPPPSGFNVHVELTPYNGYGCLDTLDAILYDTLTIQPYAGPDKFICNGSTVQLGAPPRPGLVYKWEPAAGLNDSTLANPFASPPVTTAYTLTVTNNGGGCKTSAGVTVTVNGIDTTLIVSGPLSYCTAPGISTVLSVNPGNTVQWFKNGAPIPGAVFDQFTVTQSGLYKAQLTNGSCSGFTASRQVDIFDSPTAGFTVNNNTQCFKGNDFVFSNTSTIASGAMQYVWDLGDGTSVTSTDVIHNYIVPGIYQVKLISSAAGGCKDSISLPVTVNNSPIAGFVLNSPAVQCSKNNGFSFTNTSTVPSGTLQYSWDMGNGIGFITKDVIYDYPLPGTYTIKMVVAAMGGCKDSSTVTVTVNPSPAAGFTLNNPTQCFAGNSFVFINTSSVLAGSLLYNWTMGDGFSQTTPDITYHYLQPGSYPVKLVVTASGGCADSSLINTIVYPTPVPEFSVKPVCINLALPLVNQTINNTASTLNYLWDFGNGHTDINRSPVYAYPLAGTYTVKLSVSSAQCPSIVSTKTLTVIIDAPPASMAYPVITAVMNFPEQLQARPIGNSVLWTPATSLGNRTSYAPVFKGLVQQLYTIKLATATGCVTVDTQLVLTRKKIEIYVPTAFTPGINGINDNLKPFLMGFAKLNYFRIFDRWGKLLFQTQNELPGWDGNFKGQPVEMQTVVWMIEAIDVDGIIHQKKGTTVLIH